jgi:predicted PurR-regulated permease PerM
MALTGLAIAAIIALVAGLVWGLGEVLRILGPVLWPLAVAGVVAYLLDPVVDWLERKRIPRPRAIMFVFVLAFVVVLGLFSSVVPQLINETRQLVGAIPQFSRKAQVRIEHWVNHPPASLRPFLETQFPNLYRPATNAAAEPSVDASKPSLTLHPSESSESASVLENTNIQPPAVATTNMATGARTNVTTMAGHRDGGTSLAGSIDLGTIQTATGLMAKAAAAVGSWVFGQVSRVASWLGVLAGLSLIPVYAFYLLLEKRGIESRWTDYLPVSNSAFKDELVFVLRSINSYMIAFFRGQVLVAICDGILYTIGFIIIGLPYAVLVGVMATALTIIPFLGAIVTCVSALLIMALQYGDWKHPAMVLGVFAVVQALEGLVISPKIMGDRVGLHPLTIIIAVMVGTTLLGGLLGGILAIPLTAVLRVVLSRYVWKRPAETTVGEAAE